MSLGEKIREQRKQAGLSQEQLAEKLNVSRQAITKWETDKGIPDVANLIAISDEFGLSLDELIKGDVAVKKKIIADSSAKKWHILVIVYLLAIVAYIAYFAVCHRILMIGFLIATLFMLFFELRIFIKEKYIGKTGIVTQSNSIVIDSLLHLMTLQITLGSSKNQGGHHNDIR